MYFNVPQQSLIRNQERTPTSLFLSIIFIFHSAGFRIINVHNLHFNQLHLSSSVKQDLSCLIWRSCLPGNFVTFKWEQSIEKGDTLITLVLKCGCALHRKISHIMCRYLRDSLIYGYNNRFKISNAKCFQ